MKWLAVGILALAVAACGGEKKSQPSTGSGSAGSGSAAPAAAGVKIFVDDAQVGMLAIAQTSLWPRLDTLVPVSARRLGTWQAITLTGAGPKPVTITKPSSAYPELVPAIFPDDTGKAAFGMFDPVELAKHGKPALRENGITEIRISLATGTGRGENEHGEGGGTDPAQLKVTVKTRDGETVIEGAKLLELPRESPPGEVDGGKGWRVSSILALAGVKDPKRLLLSDAKGTNLTLDGSFGDLDEKVAVPYVKLNRQGALRFRLYRKVGESWQAGADLRGLTRIEVLQ